MDPDTLPRSKHVGLEVHSQAHEGIGHIIPSTGSGFLTKPMPLMELDSNYHAQAHSFWALYDTRGLVLQYIKHELPSPSSYGVFWIYFKGIFKVYFGKIV